MEGGEGFYVLLSVGEPFFTSRVAWLAVKMPNVLFSVQGPSWAILRPHKQRSCVTKMVGDEDWDAPKISSVGQVSAEIKGDLV